MPQGSNLEQGNLYAMQLPRLQVAPDPRASIVLLGGPGTGKSTLAIITSVSLRRRIVEFDVYFQQQTGRSRHELGIDEASVQELKTREFAIFRCLLVAHSQDTIIVCPSDCLQIGVQTLLRTFAQSHPVILVVGNLSSDLNSKGNCINDSICRSCANYEYYNVSEGQMYSNTKDREAVTGPHHFPFLKLKRVEQEFLGFLGAVFRLPRRNPLIEPEIDFPLTQRSRFTSALCVYRAHLQQILSVEGTFRDGYDAVEIRIGHLDAIWQEADDEAFRSISYTVTSIRRVFPGPIILHVERPPDSNHYSRYLSLIFFALRLAIDYATVDLSCEDNVIKRVVAARERTQIIGHLHFDSSNNDGWGSLDRQRQYQRAALLNCQLVRLTQTAQSFQDNFAVQHFVSQINNQYVGAQACRPDLIAYNTGELGRMSCCFNEIFTPVCASGIPVRDDTPTGIDSSLPTLTLQDAQRALYSTYLLHKLRIYITGNHVSTSLSPSVYNAALSHLGMPHDFILRNMECITELKELISDPTFGGASIAQGLKVSVLPHLTVMSRHASAIGAVNTLIPIRADWGGSKSPPLSFWRDRNMSGPVIGLYGDNTDWIGMYRCILKSLSPINAVNPKTTGLVIGAGGTARAAVYAMIKLGVRHIFIYNRTTSKAEVLAKDFDGYQINDDDIVNGMGSFRLLSIAGAQRPRRVDVKVIASLDDAWPEGYAQPTMAICCIRAPPNSSAPAPNFTMPTQWLGSPHGGVVVETGYDPLLSPLITQIQREAHRGWVTVDGFHILPEQAAAQFELITGRKAPYIRMSIAMLQQYQSRQDPEAQDLIRTRLRYSCSLLPDTFT